MEDLRYPIGNFDVRQPVTADQVKRALDDIEETPAKVRQAIANLSPEQIETPYRPGGWTIRQVVHHLPDSHINSYTRFRFALTESNPPVKGYMEDRWAELTDARTAPMELSLNLLESLHKRWIILLRSLKTEDLKRTFQHSQYGPISLDQNVCLYGWHGRHHTAHITSLRKRMGW
jgi:uncharacterized damage-inducible protein DinB